jgi:hypothetical protein
MKFKLFTRIAAGLMFLHMAGHIMGMLTWTNVDTFAQQSAVAAMTNNHFKFMGAMRSYGDYFNGFGNACTVYMVLVVCLLWLSAKFFRQNPSIAKTLVLLTGLSLAVWAILEWVYFFPLAAGMTTLASIFSLIAGSEKTKKPDAVL